MGHTAHLSTLARKKSTNLFSIDCKLFNVSLENSSLIWSCQCLLVESCKFCSILGTQGH